MRHLLGMARIIVLGDPVLIAPHGESYHRAPVILNTVDGPIAWTADPTCGAQAERWLAVDRDFAALLEKEPCGRCWPDGAPDQLTISDADPEEGTP